ncbi:chemotaxis signal transduction protein [Candidatus Methanoperedens nitroreducens]|uniref:Chemotaxis signal transduction protein n=1 Tax=Candidatus Methanoperedens nitratireducens TaxID=1392998 RepID=A0A062V6W4_9EURY|nr:chemotaxis protein CheW [Candidatus Methanoperedens nitroreducens]KCZ71145.1 chemotaxis signal transduction protein [Candidatus Methanoperedens nitroreducens]MDJ1421477.1 chemotaxis protein CheW [Candidatus Methanoperedens sp.]
MVNPPQGTKTMSGDELQLVVFNIGREEFGVEIMNVQEIIRMINITKIPQAPDYIRGIINLRGRIIVVINLNVIMDMKSREQDENTRIIVASIGDTVMGFVVDSVSEVIRLSEKNVEPAPAIIASRIGMEYILGVGKLDNRLLILLNLGKILSTDELHSIMSISTEATEIAAI